MLSGSCNSPASESSSVVDPVSGVSINTEFSKELQKVARHCALFYACYVDVADFGQINIQQPPITFSATERFRTSGNRQLGIALDIRGCIPQKYWPLLAITEENSVGRKYVDLVSLALLSLVF